MGDEVERLKSAILKFKYVILLTIALILILIAIILMTVPSVSISKTEHIVDYTYCDQIDWDEVNIPQPCRQHVKETNSDCICQVEFNITEPMMGDVAMYYELTSYDQTSPNYVKSKDDNQLKGVLSSTPSPDCEPYRYDNATSKPIVPCGAIADAMFKDLYKLTIAGDFSTLVPLQSYGLSAEDKAGFHNPENLKLALNNYSKPMSWDIPIYELDKTNEENNGFQNEDFIAWMRTDWKRKPRARVNHTVPQFRDGLPAANYVLTVEYHKSPSTYEGDRVVVLVATQTRQSSVLYNAGLVLLVLGLLCLAGVAVPYVQTYLEERKNRRTETEAAEKANVSVDPSKPENKEPNVSPLLTGPFESLD